MSKKAKTGSFSNPPANKKYKLSLYSPNGLLRVEIPKAIFAEHSRLYGDVIRSVSSSEWLTMSELVQSYRNTEKRLRFERGRKDDDIERIVYLLVESGLVLVK